MTDWTPLVAVSAVPRQPARFVVDEVPVVVWRGPWGRPIVFVDECPHREVPLSTGRRILGGRLVCEGHGWVFDASGACVAIPNRPVSDARGRHASVVPSRVENGWVEVQVVPRHVPPPDSGEAQQSAG